MIRLAIAALFVVACAPAVSQVVDPSQLPQCSRAIPDDEADDTAVIQSAIAGSCCLGPGVYDIDMAPTPDRGRRRYDMLTVRTGQELCGAGQLATTIRFRGDAAGQDWRGIEATGGSIHDLSLDTSALIGTSEQTHAVHVTGPAQGIVIHDVTISHPIRGAWPGGDCVDLVGYMGQYVRDVVIRDSMFAHCDRGGIQAHSGVIGLTVERVVFADTGDIDINSEGSGANARWIISDNVFKPSPSNQGGTALALDLVNDVVVSRNDFARGIYLYTCTRCSFVNNRIEPVSGRLDGAVIEAIKGSNDLSVFDNVIIRPAAARAGPVVHIGPHGSAQSANVRFVHNFIEQHTQSSVFETEGLMWAMFDDNDVKYLADPAPNVFGLRALGTSGTWATTTDHVALVGNRFSGPLSATIYVSGAANRLGIGAIHAAWNASDASGLRCGELSGISGPLTLVFNTWPASSCGVPSLAAALP